MYLECIFEVVEIDYRHVKLHKWPRHTRTCYLYDADESFEGGDKVHLTIENHSPESGWVVDEVHGFHYNDEKKDCSVCLVP